jgi:hypothetical protein
VICCTRSITVEYANSTCALIDAVNSDGGMVAPSYCSDIESPQGLLLEEVRRRLAIKDLPTTQLVANTGATQIVDNWSLLPSSFQPLSAQ